MQNDILLIAIMFASRVALPIVITMIVGFMLERALRREAHNAS